jgi:hypothetical protein
MGRSLTCSCPKGGELEATKSPAHTAADGAATDPPVRFLFEADTPAGYLFEFSASEAG